MNTYCLSKPNWLLGFAFISIFIQSCSNEIELNTTGDPVPVVWCLLNPDVNEQFVRLGRSFTADPADPGKAPDADSTVYIMAVNVYMEELQDGWPSQTFRFEPVTAPPKDSGYFPNGNLRLYKADFKPIRLKAYRIYVHFPENDRIVTGTTTIPARPTVLDPLGIPGRTINLQKGVQYIMRWTPAKGAGIYQCCFRVAYSETINGVESYQEAPVVLDPFLSFNRVIQIETRASGEHFLYELSRLIPEKPGAERIVTGLQFQLYTGGEELALLVSPDLQTTTISSSLNQYTNLSHGTGLFSSIQLHSINNLELSRTTLNDIARSDQTRKLGFKDVHGGEQK